jgi:dTDP-4-amino-4,6-dideoxygalactose transaminase
MASNLGPGDVVVVPALTFAATANAARYVGAEVVFSDVDPMTGLATPETVETALEMAGPAAKSVFVVQLNGQCVDMAGIRRIADQYHVGIVEDACHAIGGTQKTTAGELPVGSCGDSSMAVFSFHPVKTVTSGEGGAVTCRDPSLAKQLRLLRSHGISRDPEDLQLHEQALSPDGSPNPWYYEMLKLGYNYRLTDIQCALGRSQLRRLRGFVAKRTRLAETYDRLLHRLGPIVRPIPRGRHGQPALHLYVVLIDFGAAGVSRAEVMKALRAHGVGTQVHYIPVNRLPYYIDRYGRTALPGADAYYDRCLSLPLFPAMSEEDIEAVVEALAKVLSK